MALSPRSCALLLFVIGAVCIQLHQAQNSIGRCVCQRTVPTFRGNMSDFQVLEKRPGCDKVELIVTLNRTGNSTDQFCVNTQGRTGKAFLKCWGRINKDEGRKMECIERKRRAE